MLCALAATLAQSDSSGALWICGGLVAIVVIAVAVASAPKKCDLCGAGIKRVSYQWTIDGKRQRLCPNCNRQLERRKSKAAVDRLGK